MSRSVDYGAVLADLKAKRAGLDQAISAIEALVSGSAVRPGMFQGMSLTEAAVAYLRFVKEKQSIREIAAALERGGFHHTSKDFTNTVRAVLGRNAQNEAVIVKDGTAWALAEWYRGRRPKPRTPAPADPADA